MFAFFRGMLLALWWPAFSLGLVCILWAATVAAVCETMRLVMRPGVATMPVEHGAACFRDEMVRWMVAQVSGRNASEPAGDIWRLLSGVQDSPKWSSSWLEADAGGVVAPVLGRAAALALQMAMGRWA